MRLVLALRLSCRSGCFCTVGHLISGTLYIMELTTPTGCPHALLRSDALAGGPHHAVFSFLGISDAKQRDNYQKGLLPLPAAQKF